MNTATMDSIDSKLWVMMAEKLGLDESSIHADSSFADDLGVDSLDVTELVLNGIIRLTTVKALVNYVHVHAI